MGLCLSIIPFFYSVINEASIFDNLYGSWLSYIQNLLFCIYFLYLLGVEVDFKLIKKMSIYFVRYIYMHLANIKLCPFKHFSEKNLKPTVHHLEPVIILINAVLTNFILINFLSNLCVTERKKIYQVTKRLHGIYLKLLIRRQ